MTPGSALRRTIGVVAIAIAAWAAAAVPATADVVYRAVADAPAGFWTPERLERARPLPLAHLGGPPAASPRRAWRAPQSPPFESFQVPDPSVAPLTTNGKVFGSLRGFGLFECSATVVSSPTRSLVFTAGHCVFDSEAGVAAKRLVFIPSYADGARPFGRWSVATARTTREWIRRGNYDFDYATMVVRPSGGRLLEDVVGARSLAVNTPRDQIYNAYGYPANRLRGRVMWTCRGPYAGDDPRPIPGGPSPVGMACDMRAGASGGGWIDDLGQLVSVTSFGYRKRPGFLYGPYLTERAARLVARSN